MDNKKTTKPENKKPTKEKKEKINLLPGKKIFGEKGIFEIRLLGEKDGGKLLVYTNVKNNLWSLGRTLPKKYQA